ncbi:hypothetical protein R3P38DRAFT_3200586 [Favolaschia claudopus]|uniref:Uncharacterized protein n=1 Tax=Favolaschia claudopus TaxID=2862362 RepID=A0AAW0AXC1_9AGAR
MHTFQVPAAGNSGHCLRTICHTGNNLTRVYSAQNIARPIICTSCSSLRRQYTRWGLLLVLTAGNGREREVTFIDSFMSLIFSSDTGQRLYSTQLLSNNEAARGTAPRRVGFLRSPVLAARTVNPGIRSRPHREHWHPSTLAHHLENYDADGKLTTLQIATSRVSGLHFQFVPFDAEKVVIPELFGTVHSHPGSSLRLDSLAVGSRELIGFIDLKECCNLIFNPGAAAPLA